jgi:hypothetical protein
VGARKEKLGEAEYLRRQREYAKLGGRPKGSTKENGKKGGRPRKEQQSEAK